MSAIPPPPSREHTCAVVVTYHPDEAIAGNVRVLTAQVAAVFIIDNASNPAARERLVGLAAELPGVTLILNDENLGIAAALNQGLARADAAGFVWALLLDQDSKLLPALMGSLRAAYGTFPNPQRLGIIGTRFQLDGVLADQLPPGLRAPAADPPELGAPLFVEKVTVITSGSLLSLLAARQTGVMREDFFIDGVDHEYCLRLRRHGYAVIEAVTPGLIHPLGAPTVRPVLGRRVFVSNHPPLRRYYIARNRLLLARAYFLSEFRWIANSLLGLAKEMLIVSLAEQERGRKLAATAMGLLHGVLNRRGCLAPETAARFASTAAPKPAR